MPLPGPVAYQVQSGCLVVAVISLGFYFWGVNTGYRTQYLDERESHDEILEGIGA